MRCLADGAILGKYSKVAVDPIEKEQTQPSSPAMSVCQRKVSEVRYPSASTD